MSPTGSRQGGERSGGLRISNPRHSRLAACATVQGLKARSRLSEDSLPEGEGGGEGKSDLSNPNESQFKCRAPFSGGAAQDAQLTEASLQSIVAAARKRWQATRLSEAQLSALDHINFEIADLADRHLGVSTRGEVRLDRRGADHGWFNDPTPADESEFASDNSETRLKSNAGAAPAGRFDLLTAVMHEMGHAAGLADSYQITARDSLMYGVLLPGERKLPTLNLAAGATPLNAAGMHFLDSPISIGTLPPGKSITITLRVTVNSPPLTGLCEVSNQGVVSGDNFADVLTDDPDTATSGDPTVTEVNRPDIPVITPNPATVMANSAGNEASGPAGLAGYAWTISNGTLTSPDNLQTITYTAGASGDVTLDLTVFSAGGCGANSSIHVPIIVPPPPPPGCSFATNYFASTTFSNGLGSSTMTLAFDGTNYWSCTGGGASGTRLARYDASGNVLSTYAPGLDFRSVFTAANGTLLARAFNDRSIYRQTSPGVFTNSGVTLTGGTLYSQSSVMLNKDHTEFLAMYNGTVSRWNLAGAYLGGVALQGFGSLANEGALPQNRGIAVVGDYWVTYNTNQVLSVWSTSGVRVAQITLSGAPTGQFSAYSLSSCNGKVFLADEVGGTWRGYDVCAPVRVALLAAEANEPWSDDVRDKILSADAGIEVDVIPVRPGDAIPTLLQLAQYRSVLTFSDNVGFNDSTALGNVLADYVDLGGGVIVATFGFYDSATYGIQGRLKTGGYLPFTTASQSQPGGLTLVKDVPSHPLLDGVNSFNGGTASYQNAPVSITNGATLVAHWSNGQPLVGAKEAGPGRVVGLNFFPPSSDVRGDFWVASTDGAQLMANALLWSGKAPPTLFSAPSDQVGIVGGSVTFNASAAGSAPLGFQWRKDGADVPGETSSNLTVAVESGSEGQYSLMVSNPYGVAFSTNATLTVLSSTNLALETVDTGWYDSTGQHIPGLANYVAGKSGVEYRDWFVFNLPQFAAPVTRGELRIHTHSIASPTGLETYQLSEVTTPVSTLRSGGSGLTGIFDDLGDGPIYATRTFLAAESNRVVSILLNQTLLTAVEAAGGGEFALGGELLGLGTGEQYLFGQSGNAGDVQLLLTVGTGDRPVAGYFTDNDPTKTGLEWPILDAGFVPLQIGDISTQDFSGLRLLLINEAGNYSLSAGLSNRLADIEAWVKSGGRLIVHDRSAGHLDPNPFLFGAAGSGTVRATSTNLDLVAPASTLVTAGPFGILDDASLDGGESSAHGYLPLAALPSGARAILSIAPDEIACFSYPLGAGFVYYSTIPLDAYLPGGAFPNSIISEALTLTYTPNVIAYLQELAPRLRLLTPGLEVNGQLPLYIVTMDGTPLSPDRMPRIRLYGATDVALPIGSWTLMNNPLVLTNGMLRVDDLNATNAAGQFFRAVEVP